MFLVYTMSSCELPPVDFGSEEVTGSPIPLMKAMSAPGMTEMFEAVTMTPLVPGLHMWNKNKKSHEGFTSQDVGGTTGTIISVAIGALAAYLSWTCNTKMGLMTGPKVAWAVLSFLGGILYLIYYAIFRRPLCN